MLNTEETVLGLHWRMNLNISSRPWESYILLSASRNTPGRDLPTETSSLERFTKNPEQELERTGLINLARGGTILLRFQDSSVVRSDQSTDEISSEEP
jgi:hypothetical protein